MLHEKLSSISAFLVVIAVGSFVVVDDRDVVVNVVIVAVVIVFMIVVLFNVVVDDFSFVLK